MRVIKKIKIVKCFEIFFSYCRMNENYIFDLFYFEMIKMDVVYNVEIVFYFFLGDF